MRNIIDSIYRDATSEISRDPRLKTRWECLPMPSKHTRHNLQAHICLYMFQNTSYPPSVLQARLRSYATSRFSCHYLLQSPYIPVPVQALIFSLKVFNFASGMHGHEAIVSFLPLVTTVDHGALPWSTLKNAISEPRACARQGHCPMRSASVLPARVDRPAEELSASSAFCK